MSDDGDTSIEMLHEHERYLQNHLPRLDESLPGSGFRVTRFIVGTADDPECSAWFWNEEEQKYVELKEFRDEPCVTFYFP